jgi:uncharacterized protein
MHIPVSDILAQEVGFQRSFEVAGEQPDLEDIVLAEPVAGAVGIRRLEDSLGVTAQLTASQTLQCHRCLQDYDLQQAFKINAEFSEKPTGEQWPITDEGTIDLGPLVRQEMVVATPIQQLCKPDCKGLDPETGKAYEEITKKESHGSTQEAKN